MKCGLFPLRAKFPIKKATRDMHAAIAELRAMATKAVKDARRKAATDEPSESTPKTEKPRKRIFEILVQWVLVCRVKALY